MTTSMILHTILALLLLIVPFGALYLLDRPSIRPFATALVRGLVQLLLFSLIVWGVYKIDNTWINIIWFVAMTIWGGLMVVSKCHLAIKDYLLPAIAGLFGGAIAVGLWLLVARDGCTIRTFSCYDGSRTKQFCNNVSAQSCPIRFPVRQRRFTMESPDAICQDQSFGDIIAYYR